LDNKFKVGDLIKLNNNIYSDDCVKEWGIGLIVKLIEKRYNTYWINKRSMSFAEYDKSIIKVNK